MKNCELLIFAALVAGGLLLYLLLRWKGLSLYPQTKLPATVSCHSSYRRRFGKQDRYLGSRAYPSRYAEQFLRVGLLKCRKAVYIGADVQRTLMHIIRHCDVEGVTLSSLADAIVHEHLSLHREEIAALLDRKSQKPRI